MHFGKRAALRLEQHRVVLERAHHSLTSSLSQRPPKPAEEFTDEVERLRSAYRASLIDTISIAKTIGIRADALNLGSAMEAILAERRLAKIGAAVAKTLSDIDRDNAKRRTASPLMLG